MPHGDLLLRFAEAVTLATDDLADARAALHDAVGSAGLAEAASTIALFSGLVRIADATGIPLDDNIASRSAGLREDLGMDTLGAARKKS